MKPFCFLRSPITQALAQRRLLSCAVFSSFALLAAPQAGAVMMDLGGLPNESTNITALVVSGDGQTLAGTNLNGGEKFFRWSADKGFSSVGSLYPSNTSNITGISGDGSTMVGYAPIGTGNERRAFIWSAASGFTDLGTLGGGSSQASGVSDNGKIIVGRAQNASGVLHAFRWAEGTMNDLGGLVANGVSFANGVSGDGKVAVGASATASGTNEAVTWDEAGTIKSLGINGAANAANVDGTVVVGEFQASGKLSSAFRWTASGGVQDLGNLGGLASYAKDVNADGSVVVGSAQQTDRSNRAFRWTEATGMTNLGVLSGTTSSVATGVSDDGKIVVGTSGTRGFIWKEDAPAMQDLENLQLSQITSAATLGQLTAAQNRRLRDLTQQQCIPTDAQQYCLSSGLSTYRGEATSSGNQVVGQASGGLRINEQFAVGASLNLGQADLKTEGAEQNNAYGLALWGSYQQQPNAQGWVGSASVGMGHSRNSFERGVGLTDVQRAQARTEMNSTSVRVAVGYGVQVGSSLVTPEIALSHTRTNSDGFTERNVAFPLTVNAASSDETYATFGVRSETPLTPKTTLQLGAAVDALLSDNTDPIEGRSAVPGLNRFQLRSNLDKRDLLPVANAGVSYALSPNSSVSGQVQVGASTHKEESAVYGVGVQYRYAF